MKIKTFYTVLFLFIVAVADAQIQGTWKGSLDAGVQKLTIVFHFKNNAEGKPTCTLDSPDQGAKDIPATVLLSTADSVSVDIPVIGGSYRGRISGNSIRGTFTQGPASLPLNLEPGEVVYNRPQEPQPPYPYKTADFTFVNTQAGATLAGTLTYPTNYRQGQKVPVVIMVSGSGLQNRDEELMGHKPFKLIAHWLATHGTASLRYDDRGFGASTGDVAEATTADFAEDASAGIEALRKTGKFSEVDVLGHSEGAAIAFILAARGKADKVIALAGPAVKGDTLLTEQYNIIMESTGLQGFKRSVAQERAVALATKSTWMSHFLDYDPTADLKAIRCPVLALYGSKDLQVPPRLNIPALQKALTANKHTVIKEYPGLNHLFQHCATGLPTEYGSIEETLSTEVLDDIVEWLKR